MIVLVPAARALPPADYFEPDLTMYSFADLWIVRPISAAVLPLTMTTFAVGAPVVAGSGGESVQRSYEILVGDPSAFLAARPLGSFFDWENRDKTKPVVIQFPEGYTVAELSPQQERRYRVALQEHKERIMAIERETELPETDRKAFTQWCRTVAETLLKAQQKHGLWLTEDEEDLVEEITCATGWCIKSINYRHILT